MIFLRSLLRLGTLFTVTTSHPFFPSPILIERIRQIFSCLSPLHLEERLAVLLQNCFVLFMKAGILLPLLPIEDRRSKLPATTRGDIIMTLGRASLILVETHCRPVLHAQKMSFINEIGLEFPWTKNNCRKKLREERRKCIITVLCYSTCTAIKLCRLKTPFTFWRSVCVCGNPTSTILQVQQVQQLCTCTMLQKIIAWRAFLDNRNSEIPNRITTPPHARDQYM
jgi:hypothetical protein